MKNGFRRGLLDGLSIGLGYLAVSFAFGIFAVSNGFSPVQSLIVSMTNVTSAGQIAAVPIIAGGGTLFELAASQIIINLRYALMSLSLSQKLDGSVRLIDRFIIAFVNTDEVFATAAGKNEPLCRRYLYGLIIMPWLGWTLGTLLGAVADTLLPQTVISALNFAVYALLIAVIIPQIKQSGALAICAVSAITLSCGFRYLPVLNAIPSGFSITLIAIIVCTAMALIRPIAIEERGDGRD